MNNDFILEDVKSFYEEDFNMQWDGTMIDEQTGKITQVNMSDFDYKPLNLILHNAEGEKIIHKAIIAEDIFHIISTRTRTGVNSTPVDCSDKWFQHLSNKQTIKSSSDDWTF